MRSLRDIPIKRKLTIITMMTSGVALLLACIAFVTYEQVSYRRTMATELSMLTDMFDDNVTAGLTFNDARSIETALNSLSAHPRIIAAAVYDKAGQQVAKYQRDNVNAVFPSPGDGLTRTEFKENRLDAFRRIILTGENIGTIYIASDLREITARFWRYGLIVSIVLVLSSLVALVLSAKLQHVISGPISHLASVAHAVATEKNYSVRAAKHGEDELGSLIDGFNEMLAQIQARDAQLQHAQDLLEKRVEERTGELRQEVAGHKRSVQALCETNQRFEIVTRATTDVIWDWNLTNNNLWWNENFQTVFGYPIEQIGTDLKSWNSRIHPEDVARVLQSIYGVIDGGGHLWSSEYRFRRHDGGYAHVFDRGYVLHDDDGRPTRMIGAMQDITERKQAEDARHQSESQFRQVWNASADGMRLTNRDGLVLMVNDAYCRLVEKEREELEEKSLLIIHHEQDREGILRRHWEILNAVTGPTHLEKEIVLWNGKKMWIEVSNSLLQLPGQSPLLLSLFRDISLRKAAEAELQETHRKLLEISRQAGMAEVATGVLHNVGNVLNSVNVSATLVTDALKHSKTSSLHKAANLLLGQPNLAQFFAHDPRARELPGYLAQLAQHLGSEQELMVNELQSLQTNIGHIKDIVAMQQNYAKVSGVIEKVTLEALVEDALRMNEAALARHDVTVVRNFAEVPPIIVDKHKVLQILVNLIRNAKFACDDAQRADKQLVVRIGKNDLSVFIDVIDNGVGIPKGNLTRIFEHGFTTRKNGHGFGLHSGALAAKELGGALRVLSEGLGCGATFTIELPFHPPQSLAA